MQKQAWVILTVSHDGRASPGSGYERVPLYVSFVYSLIFLKKRVYLRGNERAEVLSKGHVGGEEEQAGTKLSAETEAWLDPRTLRS